MRYCPRCQATYDEEMQFCLEDGAALLNRSNADSLPPTVAFGETETVVRQNVMLPGWEPSHATRLAKLPPATKNSNAPLIAVVTALTLFVLLSGAVGVLILAGGGLKSEISSGNYSVTNDTYKRASPSPPIITKKGTGWEPINNQASLNGTNLTYYRGTTAEQCQADCDKNSKCKAFTLIRAGAYNPNDPPMCYLAAEVSGSTPSTCCISAIKSENGDGATRVDAAETRKVCDYFLSAGLYEKWQQKGGKDGKSGCPLMNEIAAEKSPQGTTGRLTSFGKGDGGFIIRHESGRFAGTTFEVSGCMFKLYADLGGTDSWLGFPVKDGYPIADGARQDFEGGYILWDSKTYNCQAFRN